MGRRERGTLTVHSECEETPGEEAGLWAERPEGTVKCSAWRGPASGCLLKGQQAMAHRPAPSPHRQETVAAPAPAGPR